LAKASKRPRRYDPLVCDDDSTLDASVAMAPQPYREASRAFLVRATLRLGEGKTDEAWKDLLACHRMARLVGQGPTVIDALVAGSIERTACRGDQTLLQHVRLTATDAALMRDGLGSLPPLFHIADKFDIGDRFDYLHRVSLCARSGIGALEHFWGWRTAAPVAKGFLPLAVTVGVDWDEVLRLGNSVYDRIADACRQPKWAQRRESLRKIAAEVSNAAEEAGDVKSLALSVSKDARRAVSERLGRIFLAEVPEAIASAVQAEDMGTMELEFVRLAFALATYRAGRGSYPAKLADLVPECIARLPRDFNDAELGYRQQDGGYVLSSVGPNCRDDSERSYSDRRESGDDWDDMVFRVRGEAEDEAARH
jgi:hypothetical protein